MGWAAEICAECTDQISRADWIQIALSVAALFVGGTAGAKVATTVRFRMEDRRRLLSLVRLIKDGLPSRTPTHALSRPGVVGGRELETHRVMCRRASELAGNLEEARNLVDQLPYWDRLAWGRFQRTLNESGIDDVALMLRWVSRVRGSGPDLEDWLIRVVETAPEQSQAGLHVEVWADYRKRVAMQGQRALATVDKSSEKDAKEVRRIAAQLREPAGEEGFFYLWGSEDLKKMVDTEAERFERYLGNRIRRRWLGARIKERVYGLGLIRSQIEAFITRSSRPAPGDSHEPSTTRRKRKA